MRKLTMALVALVSLVASLTDASADESCKAQAGDKKLAGAGTYQLHDEMRERRYGSV